MQLARALCLSVTLLYLTGAWYVHALELDWLALILTIIGAGICYHWGKWSREQLVNWRWKGLIVYLLMYPVGLFQFAYDWHIDFLVGTVGVVMLIMGLIASWSPQDKDSTRQRNTRPGGDPQ